MDNIKILKLGEVDKEHGKRVKDIGKLGLEKTMNQVIWEEIKKNSEILAYYDCPQLFTAFGYYIVLAEPGEEYLVSIIPSIALEEFRKGAIDLRSLILLKSNAWFLINEENTFECTKLESLDEYLLPESGYCMGL